MKFQVIAQFLPVARLTTAAIVQRRGYAAVRRRIPRLCATNGKTFERDWFSVPAPGYSSHALLYPRLVPIAAVVSRATKVTSRLRRDKPHFYLRPIFREFLLRWKRMREKDER